MKTYMIGVDIGGTNSDVVLVDAKGHILAARKEITSKPLHLAASRAIDQLLADSCVLASQIGGVFFGTTHATNAILEVKELLGVGLVRIAGHRPDSSPAYSWPDELRKAALLGYETIDGGCECDGRSISSFDAVQAEVAVTKLLERGVQAISVVGTFSPVDPTQELQLKEIVKRVAGEQFPLSLSHEIGGIGFLERENATILNSSLKRVIANGFSAIEASMRALGIMAPLYMVQNDGSIMDLELAIKMPILTIGAGQTNSFIGGCKVAKVSSAVVLDIGGTSTDIGSVIDGVAKRSCHATKIGGVELHFAMPDVLSLALGGGSIINDSQIGPESVARRLKEQAQCFGGKKLTLTDVGVFLDILDIPGASKSSISLTTSAAKHHLATIGQKLVSSLRIAMGKHRNLPIVVVGGAAAMVRAALTDTEFGSLVMIPEHSGVANAYGASLAEVSATITVVLPLGSGREELLDKIKAKTCEEAILKGAALTRIANVEIIPYAYSKDGLAKVSVTALGPRNWRLPKDVASLG